jgi:hypothetical protein
MNQHGLAEARAARELAERKLEEEDRSLVVPLRDMHRVNHIGPLVSELVARRGRDE